MSDFQAKVVIGNLAMYPGVLRNYLVKSHYFLNYDPETESLVLNVNHGGGGEVLFEVRNVSYESAVKLAESFGLKGDGGTPLVWSKWNPILVLHHDGTKDAESLRMEMLRLGIPHKVHYGARVMALSNGQGRHEAPCWSTAGMLQIVRETAERYKDQLSTTP